MLENMSTNSCCHVFSSGMRHLLSNHTCTCYQSSEQESTGVKALPSRYLKPKINCCYRVCLQHVFPWSHVRVVSCDPSNSESSKAKAKGKTQVVSQGYRKLKPKSMMLTKDQKEDRRVPLWGHNAIITGPGNKLVYNAY